MMSGFQKFFKCNDCNTVKHRVHLTVDGKGRLVCTAYCKKVPVKVPSQVVDEEIVIQR